MNVPESEVVRVSLRTPPHDLASFLRDLHSWKAWAPWIRTVQRTSSGDWTLDTEAGPMAIHFVDSDTPDVLDHEVTLASGVKILNSLRVSAQPPGSELAMVVVQQPGASPEEFRRDVHAVRDDFARLKKVIETRTNAPS